jgi:hypothetical protein
VFFQSFNDPFKGQYHRILLNTLDRYVTTLSSVEKSDQLYNMSISFVQSSCTGKSRVVDEAAHLRLAIVMNLRESLGAHQFSEVSLFDVFYNSSYHTTSVSTSGYSSERILPVRGHQESTIKR